MAAPLIKEDKFTQDKGGYVKAANEDFYSSNVQRIKTGDRSDQLRKINQARNVRTEVRTSSMPGAPRNKQFDSSRPDIATEFNQSYAKKGIQPLSLDDRPAREPYQPARPINRAQVEYSSQPIEAPPQQKTRLKLKNSKASLLKSGLARARVTGLNTWVWSAGIFTWLFFQLPFAILSLVFLGMAAAIETLTKVTDDDGVIVSIGKQAIGTFIDFTAAILKIVGIDIEYLNPKNYFLLFHTVVLVYGIFVLLIIYLLYKLAFLNPLSGRGEGMKKGAFMLALVGYSFPVLNLIPWFIFWTMAVWRYPK